MASVTFTKDWSGSFDPIQLNNVVDSVVTNSSPAIGRTEYDAKDVLKIRPDLWETSAEVMANYLRTMVVGVQDKTTPDVRITRMVDAIPADVPNDSSAKAMNSLYSMVVVNCLSVFSEVVYNKSYPSIGHAWKDLQWIIDKFDSEIAVAAATCNYQLYSELYKSRSAIVAKIMDKIVTLPGMVEYDIGIQLPSLIASMRMYGDSTRAVEVEGFNYSHNPMAMGYSVWGKSR